MYWGFNLVSYGIVMKAYNKFVHNRPFSPDLTPADLVVVRQVRYLTRFWVAGLIAPMMIWGVKGIFKNTNLINMNINIDKNLFMDNISNNVENSKIENNSKKTIIPFLIILWKKVSIRFLFALLCIILWFSLVGFRENVYNLYKNILYCFSYLNFTYILYILIIIPLILNLFTIILWKYIEKNGGLTVPTYLPNFIKKILNYCIRIGTNKELLDYYRGRGIAEMYFYALLLLINIIIHYFLL
jgi:hypothetical protein